jgi:4-amino-4-deoxy-L-arabinose transferase-like glycosyltransferase
MLFRLRKPALPSAVYWLAALAFALRIAVRLHSGIADFWVNGYRFYFDMAQSIAAGKGIAIDGAPTAFRVPLYSIFLAGLTMGHKAFWPIAVAQSMIGAGTAFCAALLARQMFRGPAEGRAAILAAAITAVYPYYVVHDTAMQETSLFTLLTLIAVILAQRIARTGALAPAAICGLLLGLDVLTRAPIALFALIVPIWLISKKRTVPALLCALLLVLTIFPWLWRSYKLTGEPMLTTESGYELWNGNNDILFRYYPRESVDVSIKADLDALTAQDQRELSQLGGNEALIDHWFLHKGLAYIHAHPWLTFTNGLRKIAAAFDWLPTPRRSLARSLSHAFSFGPVMVLGLWGMWRRRSKWRKDSLIYLMFAQFLVVTAVYFGQTSHRVYLDVYWIVFAAGALAKTPLLTRVWAATEEREVANIMRKASPAARSYQAWLISRIWAAQERA